MAAINTGIVLRTITGVHDANFVHPLGDEEIVNRDFSNGTTDWELSTQSEVVNSQAKIISTDGSFQYIQQTSCFTVGKTYKLELDIISSNGAVLGFAGGIPDILDTSSLGRRTMYVSPTITALQIKRSSGVTDITIDNVSVKEVLVNRESTATNTGIVERSIVGVHDANFVHPIGDEELNTGVITNAGGGSFTFTPSGLKAVSDGTSSSTIRPRILWNTLTIGKQYRIVGTPTINSGNTSYSIYDGATYVESLVAVEAFDITLTCNGVSVFFINDGTQTFDIDWDLSIKEVLVNRESTTTNTGIVERPITGVNESDPMFPDNTISNIVNIAGLISSLIADLKARATTFENEDATRNILINLQNC